MKQHILMELGLSLNESKIYLSLLEQGAANANRIAEISGIHRVNVYDSVHKLKERGLVSEVSLEGKRLFQASPPEVLKNIIKAKEIKLNTILNELELVAKLSRKNYEVQVYEGWDFIRNLFLHCLQLKEPIFALDVPITGIQKLGHYFQEVIHKRRAEQNQMMYHIYSREAMERIKFLNTLPYTEARYLEKEHEGNVTTTICGEEVAIHVIYEHEQQKPLTIMIKNRQIADAYRTHFWLLWEKAKLPEK